MSFIVNDTPATTGVTAAAIAAAFADPDDAADVFDVLTTYADPMAGAGWTTGAASGGATASWTAGTLVLSVPTASVGAIQVTRPDLLQAPDSWDAALRVTVTTGDGAAAVGRSLVWSLGADANNRVQLQILSSGDVEIIAYIAGSPTVLLASAAFGPTTGNRTGGQLWYRVRRDPRGVSVLWGVGSAGAPPVLWTLLDTYATTEALAASQGTWSGISVYCPNAVTGGYVLTLGAIHSLRIATP